MHFLDRINFMICYLTADVRRLFEYILDILYSSGHCLVDRVCSVRSAVSTHVLMLPLLSPFIC